MARIGFSFERIQTVTIDIYISMGKIMNRECFNILSYHYGDRMRVFLSLAVLGVLTAACGSDATLPSDNTKVSEQPIPISREVSKGLELIQMPPSLAVIRGKSVIVDGDIRLDLEYVEKIGRSFFAAEADTSRVMNQTSVASNLIPVLPRPFALRVSTAAIQSNSEWLESTRQAINYFNTTTGIAFMLIETEQSPDIVVSFETQPPNVFASAKFPNGSSFGDSILVNTVYAGGVTPEIRLYVMVHEFGHTIGFRHTDWEANGEASFPEDAIYGRVRIPGTPSTDIQSIMNSIVDQPFPGWSFYDLVALRTLYPQNGPTVTHSVVNGRAQLAWSAQTDALNYDVLAFDVIDPFGSATKGFARRQNCGPYPTTGCLTGTTTFRFTKPSGGSFSPPNPAYTYRGKFVGLQQVQVGWFCAAVQTRYPGNARSSGESDPNNNLILGCYS